MQSFDYPTAPVDVEGIARAMNFKLYYDALHGPAGLTYRKLVKSTWRYAIFIASDMNSVKYTTQQIKFRQRYTIAHEIGHILLHNHLDDWNNVTDEQDAILEVEANWFASRLLMPNYCFSSIQDMDPEQLSLKCQVNYQAAQKRLNYLDKHISNALIRQATDLTSFFIVDEIISIEYDFDFEQAYEEIASTEIKSVNLIDDISVGLAHEVLHCFKCGEINMDTRMLLIVCHSCGNLLRY